MTFLQMRTLVWSYVDDPDGGYFTTSQVNVFLNNAQKEVQKILMQAFEGFNLKPVKTTLVVNQAEYALPSDFKRIHRLELILSGTPPNEDISVIQKITRQQQDMLYRGPGNPAAYFFQGNYIVLVPTPSTALTMKLYYEYLIADMSADGDEPDLPKQYHEMIPIIAARDCLIKDGRDASLLQKKIDDFEKNMKRDAEQRNADAPRTVVQTYEDDDNIGNWW